MTTKFYPRWLAALLGHSNRPTTTRKTPRTRLVLERLEDRDTPTTFNLSGTTLTIFGTPVNDNFAFTKNTAYSGGILSTTYTFDMNDQEITYTDSQVGNVLVYGLGGSDTAVMTLNDSFMIGGQPNNQQLAWWAVLSTGGGYVVNDTGSVFMQLYQFQNSTAYLPNNATGFLYVPPSNDGIHNSLMVTAGNYSYVTGYEIGGNEFHLLSGGKAIYGFSTRATDQLYHYDAGVTSTFVSSGNAYSYMSGTQNGNPFFNVGMGFNINYAFATQGIGDTAYFYDTPAKSDSFVGNTTFSYLSGTVNGQKVFNEAQNFGHVYASSFVGGVDFAYLNDPSVNTETGFILIPQGPRNS